MPASELPSETPSRAQRSYPEAAAVGAEPAQPHRIGEHVVLQELGRGGMARVYRVRRRAQRPRGRAQATAAAPDDDERERRRRRAVRARVPHARAALAPARDRGLRLRRRRRPARTTRWSCSTAATCASARRCRGARRARCSTTCARRSRCCTRGAWCIATSARATCAARATGRAKLIDFGAMAPMGPGAQVVGTPAFVAPEVVHRVGARRAHRSVLARRDAVLRAHRRMPYPARDFARAARGLAHARRRRRRRWSPDVPPALDALVMSLISLEPALRPRSAFEVMQRLAAIAGIAARRAAERVAGVSDRRR